MFGGLTVIGITPSLRPLLPPPTASGTHLLDLEDGPQEGLIGGQRGQLPEYKEVLHPLISNLLKKPERGDW